MIMADGHGGLAAVKGLVVHGDDFGLSAAVNRGIWRAWRDGILTAASLVANGSALDEACALAAGSGLVLGLHLNLTCGRPLLPAERLPSLTDGQGNLPGKWDFWRRALCGRLSAVELTDEINAQFDRLDGLGVRVDHLDSHHHVHLLPAVAAAAAPLMKERGIRWVRRVRGKGEPAGSGAAALLGRLQQRSVALTGRRCEKYYREMAGADDFYGFSWYLHPDPGSFLAGWASGLERGRSEWMCHPADYAPGAPATAAEKRRQRECELLCAPETRRILEQAGIELMTLE